MAADRLLGHLGSQQIVKLLINGGYDRMKRKTSKHC